MTSINFSGAATNFMLYQRAEKKQRKNNNIEPVSNVTLTRPSNANSVRFEGSTAAAMAASNFWFNTMLQTPPPPKEDNTSRPSEPQKNQPSMSDSMPRPNAAFLPLSNTASIGRNTVRFGGGPATLIAFSQAHPVLA